MLTSFSQFQAQGWKSGYPGSDLLRDKLSQIHPNRYKVLPSYSTFKPRLRIWVYFDEAVAVLSPKQGKCADTGKGRTYPAPQSKI